MGPWLKPCVCLVEHAPLDAPWPVRHPDKVFRGIASLANAEKSSFADRYAMLQKKLLESEGVKLIESRVQLNLHAWKPPAKTSAAGKQTTSKARKATGTPSPKVLDPSHQLAQVASRNFFQSLRSVAQTCRIQHLCYNSFR